MLDFNRVQQISLKECFYQKLIGKTGLLFYVSVSRWLAQKRLLNVKLLLVERYRAFYMRSKSFLRSYKKPPNSNSISLRWLIDCALQAEAINQFQTLESRLGPKLRSCTYCQLFLEWNWFSLHCFVAWNELFAAACLWKSIFPFKLLTFLIFLSLLYVVFSLAGRLVMKCDSTWNSIADTAVNNRGSSHAPVHITLGPKQAFQAVDEEIQIK